MNWKCYAHQYIVLLTTNFNQYVYMHFFLPSCVVYVPLT
jgi:hypothetical protein